MPRQAFAFLAMTFGGVLNDPFFPFVIAKSASDEAISEPGGTPPEIAALFFEKLAMTIPLSVIARSASDEANSESRGTPPEIATLCIRKARKDIWWVLDASLSFVIARSVSDEANSEPGASF